MVADPAGTEFIDVKLARSVTLSRVDHYNDGQYGARSVTVKTSVDGSTWQTAGTYLLNSTPNIPVKDTLSFTPVTAQYVRLEYSSFVSGSWLQVNEIQSVRNRHHDAARRHGDAAYRDGDPLPAGIVTPPSGVVAPPAIPVPPVVLTPATLSTPKVRTAMRYGRTYSVVGYLKPHHTAGTKPVRIKAYRRQRGEVGSQADLLRQGVRPLDLYQVPSGREAAVPRQVAATRVPSEGLAQRLDPSPAGAVSP